MEKYIVWDWNGTLLDDVEYARAIVNSMLESRGKNKVSRETYQACFGFPIIDYYKEIGFEFEHEQEYFKIVNEFNELYRANLKKCGLFRECEDVLQYFKQKGYIQFILSGLNKSDLNYSLKLFGINSFFRDVYGSDSMDAKDKWVNGLQLIEKHNIQVEHLIYIGDTIEDYKTSRKLNCMSILVATGHQSFEKLKSSGSIVANNLCELVEIIG